MKKILILILIIGAVAFGYWTISPLFRQVELNEAAPDALNQPAVKTAEDKMLDGAVTEEKTEVKSESVTEAKPQATTSVRATVVGTPGHAASGFVRIVEADGKRYLRYESFKTINGPDLYVYLSSDLQATDFVSLGRVRATEGNVNYEIPADLDLEKYKYALTWCKAFSVLFNSAELN